MLTYFLFLFITRPPPYLYTLSLHDALPISLEVREARAALEGPGHRLQQAMHGFQVPEMSGPQRGIEVHIARDVEGIRPGHGRHRGIGRRTGAAQIQQALVDRKSVV